MPRGKACAKIEVQEQAAIAKAVNNFLNELLIQADVRKQGGKGKDKKKKDKGFGKGPDKGRDPDVTVRALLDQGFQEHQGQICEVAAGRSRRPPYDRASVHGTGRVCRGGAAPRAGGGLAHGLTRPGSSRHPGEQVVPRGFLLPFRQTAAGGTAV